MRELLRRPLFALLAWNGVGGVAVGWLLLAGLVASDVGGLGHLLARSPDALPVLVLAAGGFAVTFGSLAMGTAVFLLERTEAADAGPPTARDRVAPAPLRLPVRSASPRRRP